VAERPLKHPFLRKRGGGKAHIIRNWKKRRGRKTPEPPVKKKDRNGRLLKPPTWRRPRSAQAPKKFMHLMKERGWAEEPLAKNSGWRKTS
jgi:hypothetical protein